MTTFTDKELIKEIKERIGSLDVRDNIERRAYEIALASLAAEPVAVNDDMAYAFHHALSDSSLGSDEIEEIKTGLRAALANVSSPVTPDGLISCSERMRDDGREQFEALIRFHAGDKNHETLLLRANEGMNYQDPNVDLAWIFWKSSREHI